MARHCIMDPSGHSTIEFDKADQRELAEVEARFNRLVAKGYAPAIARGEGTHFVTEKNARKFNPNADVTLFISALRGG